jgi:hypothetical protein
MPLTVDAVLPGPLTLCEARIGNAGNFTTLEFVEAVGWQIEILTELLAFENCVVDGYYGELEYNCPGSRGRRMNGALFTRDPNTVEALVNAGPVGYDLKPLPTDNTNLQLRFTFRIPHGTCTKHIRPVAFGVKPTRTYMPTTLLGPDGGKRPVFVLPWVLLMDVTNCALDSNYVSTTYACDAGYNSSRACRALTD